MPRWLIILLFLVGELHAQEKLDSLLEALQKGRESDDAYAVGNSLTKLAVEFLRTRNYDSARNYYYQALRWNTLYGHADLVARNLNDLGIVNDATGFPDSAIYYYNRALLEYQTTPDSSKAVETRVNLGIVYKDLGLYEEALNTSFKAALTLESAGPGRALSSCYNTIALVYGKTDNVEQALLFHRKALSIRESIAYQRGIGQSYNNIANLYRDLGRYDSALSYYLKALASKRTQNDNGGAASTLHNMGDVLLLLEQPGQAEPYFNESLLIKQRTDDRKGEVSTLNSLGRMELLRNNLSMAKGYLRQAEERARTLRHLEELRINYQAQAELYERLKDYQTAFQYSQKLIIVKDDLLDNEKLSELMQVRIRYEAEKAEQAIQLLRQEKALQQAEIKNKRTWIIALVVISILIAAVGALLYKMYKKSQQHKTRTETLWKELDHRVKNMLQIMSSLFTLQASHLTDPKALEAIKSSGGRVNAMAIIHKILSYENQNQRIYIRGYITELTNYLLHAYGYEGRMHRLELDITDVQIDVDRAVRLGLVANEIISNAFKYAYADASFLELTVRILKTGEELTLCIADNGPGLGVEKTGRHSFGLSLVHTLVRDLKGNMNVNTEQGTAYTITIPINDR